MIILEAPLENTIDQFWRMVWECNVEAIIMLAKCVEMGRVSYKILKFFNAFMLCQQEKSAMYWPGTLNETVNAGEGLSISLSSSTPYAEYHVRHFRLKHVCDQTDQSEFLVTLTKAYSALSNLF